MNTALLVLTVVALGGIGTFVALFALTPWWRSEMGWHLMTFMSIEAVVLLLTLARSVFGDYPGRDVLLLLFFAAFAAAGWWRASILIRTQLAHLRRPDREEPS